MLNSLHVKNKLRFLLINAFLFSLKSYGVEATSGDPALKFIENKNQWSQNVHFSAKIPGGNMVIGPGEFAYYFIDVQQLDEWHQQKHNHFPDADGPLNVDIRGHKLRAEFIGANLASRPMPSGKSSEYYNYYIGNNPDKWASGAYAYREIVYSSFYNDIDLKIYASGDHLKYDFVVAPCADPTQILIAYEGAESMFLENGDLYIKTSLADVIEKKPIAFQYINGKKIFVDCEYELHSGKVSFCFPDGYDTVHELIIDPLLIFSTFSGSTADNWGSTATPGEKGTLYSSGITNHFITEFVNGTRRQTFSGTFPATAGAFQTTYGGVYDVGILKYDSTGSELLYASYLGGSDTESSHSLIVNKNDELIVLGTTGSDDFPTSDLAFDRTHNGGVALPEADHVLSYNNGIDIFIAKFSPDGSQLLASTFLGGSKNDGLNDVDGGLNMNYGDELRGDVATDDEGNIYISSVTASDDFFTGTTGFDLTYNNGSTDAILVKLKPDLSQIIWGTYLGGSGTDASHTLKLDAEGNVYIGGGTTSLNFPMLGGGHRTTKYDNIDVDGWIARVAKDGASVLSSTFVGSDSPDQVYFIDLNDDNEIYVYGQTVNTAGNFLVTPGVYSNPGSGQFVQKFNHSLSAVLFSTVFGSGRGIPDISPTAFLVNDCNNLYMAGWGGMVNTGFWNSNTIGMPVSPDAIQGVSTGSDFYFIVLTEDASQFLYGTYLGGNLSRTHVDGGTSRFDKTGIVYHAVCSGCRAFNPTNGPTSDFPTTPGAWSTVNNSKSCNNAAFKFDLSSLKARLQTNSVKLDNPGLAKVCQPDSIVFQNLSIGGEIFQWDLGDGTHITRIDNSAVIHAYQNPGQYLVKLKALDQGTCKAVDSTSTTVSVFKLQATVQNDDDLCEGESYQLSGAGGVFYEWKASTGDVSTGPAPTVTPVDTTIYYVTVADRNGCFLKDTVRLNVVRKINPEFTFTRIHDCFNRPFIRVKNLTDSLDAGDMMFLDYGDGNTTDLPSDEHHYEEDATYLVRLVGTRHGCVFEKSVSIPVHTIKIPNVITPGNPEGLNDKLTVNYGDTDGTTPTHYGFKVALAIYDRWGGILYKTDDYRYDWSGENLASGIYYYEMTIEGHSPPCKTWLHLIK